MSAAAAAEIDALRKAWKDANLAPLWENKFAHRPPPPPEATYLWSWEKIRPLIAGAIKVASPEAVERRVLQLDSSASDRGGGAADVEDARHQYPDPAAGREGASAPPHHECVALRAGRLGRDHDRGRQGLSDGGGRSDPHAGLDLARACPSGHALRSCGSMRSTCRCTITWGRARSSRDRWPTCRRPSPMPPLRSPMSCPTWTMPPGTIPRSSAIPTPRRRRRSRRRRPRATARGACATSTRSPAAPGWR